jgi:PAS domain S-box-containing protein
MTQARILIVEDEIVVANNMALRLESLGYSVVAILTSGEEAVRQAAKMLPDLVLMDIKLRGKMDGVEAADEIRTGLDIPIVYLTGYSDDLILQRAKITEPFGYLLKPFEIQDLHSTLEMALYKHAIDRQLRESEKKYRTLVEHSLQGILIALGSPPRVVYANQVCAEMTGYTVEEMLSLPPDKVVALLHPEDQEMLLGRLPTQLAGRPVSDGGELRIIRRDGTLCWMQYFVTAVEYEGEPAVQVVFLDITARKQAEEVRKQAHAELEVRVAERTAELEQEVEERRRVERDLQLHAGRLSSLREIDQAILAAQSPDEIARAALEHIRRLVLCPRASVAVFDAEAKRATVLAAHVKGETQLGAGRQLPLEAFGLTAELRACQVRTVPDLEAESRLTATDEILLSEGVRSYATIPLIVQDRLSGTLNLGSDRTGAFSPDQIQIAQEVAAPLAIAIQQARLRERLERYTEGLEETVAQRTRELQAERDRTQAILETVGESVVVTDTQGQILYANPATEALTGFNREESISRTWHLWSGEQQPERIHEDMQRVLRAGQTWRGEMVGRRQNATSYDAAVTVAPLFDSEQPGQVVGSVWVQRDITPLKEAERFKDQFISNLSHELRTPLSIIALTSDNLAMFYERLDGSQRWAMLQDIREQAQVLNDLIGDVLEISRIDGGRISAQRAKVHLAQLVQAEAEKQRPLVEKRSQTLTMIGDDPLPVWADDGQIRQVIRNLLNNAIKYTPDGGQITCECLQASGEQPRSGGSRWAVVRVADTGIGIDPQHLARIFERFYRVQTEGSIPGTGLGLSIAQELVALHGGRITVSSVPGQGSVFSVYLPLLVEERS